MTTQDERPDKDDQWSVAIMVNDEPVFTMGGPKFRFNYRLDRNGSTMMLTATLRLDKDAQEAPPEKEE